MKSKRQNAQMTQIMENTESDTSFIGKLNADVFIKPFGMLDDSCS